MEQATIVKKVRGTSMGTSSTGDAPFQDILVECIQECHKRVWPTCLQTFTGACQTNQAGSRLMSGMPTPSTLTNSHHRTLVLTVHRTAASYLGLYTPY